MSEQSEQNTQGEQNTRSQQLQEQGRRMDAVIRRSAGYAVSDPAPAQGESQGEPGKGAGEADKKPVDNEAAYWRRQAEKSERELKSMQRANMSETERAKAESEDAKKRADESEARFKNTLIDIAIKDAAREAGAINPAIIAKLINREQLKIDGGQVQGVLAQIKDLHRSSPYMFDRPFREGAWRAGGGGITPTSDFHTDGASKGDSKGDRLKAQGAYMDHIIRRMAGY